MYCGNCGKEISEESKFCPYCGWDKAIMDDACKEVSTQTYSQGYPIQNESNAGVNQAYNNYSYQTANSAKSVPVGAFVGGGIGLVALIVAFVYLIISVTTIDLNRYLRIETTGYNGYGTAKVSIDWDLLKQEHGDHLAYTDLARREYIGSSGMASPVYMASSYIRATVDKSSNLANGDIISFDWIIDENLSRYIDGRIKCSPGTYTVSDLKEVATFDAFADLEVEFSGISPNGTVIFKYNGSDFSKNSFKSNKSTGLKNGDIIEISISDDINVFAKRTGRAPAAKTKQYTVSGLPEYISSGSDITASQLSDLKKSSEDTIYSYIANRYFRSSVSNLQYVGYYLIKMKEGRSSYFSAQNKLFLVFSGDVTSTAYSKTGTAKAFFPVSFSNIQKQSDGSIKFVTDNSILGEFTTSDIYGWINGFTSGAEMYNSIVTKNRADYDYEVSDSLKQFGN